MKPARLFAFLFLVAAIRAQTAAPAGGEPLLGDPLASFKLTAPDAATAALTTVDASGPGFTRALRLETKRDSGPAWAIEVRAPLARAAAERDAGLMHFFVRTIAASDETGGGQLRVAIQANSSDAPRTADTQFSVGTEWQEFFVPFAFARDFAAGEATIVFGLGYKHQTIELGGCEVLHYGTRAPLASLPKTRFTYAGREPGAAWRKEALARIEKIRKGDFTLAVVDAAGRPVPGATVRVEERAAAFQFGSALQFARLVHDTPENLRYREKVLELFNAASPENDLKWPPWVGEWDGYSREQAIAGLHWLRDHGLHVRGHVLVYPAWRGDDKLPKFLRTLRGTPRQSEIPQLVLDHISDEAGATRGLLEEWDVVNEPWDNHELMDLFGRDVMVDWFRAARAALPDVRLVLNDYSNHDAMTDRAHVENFEANARFLLEKHAPLGGLGLQSHIGSTPNAPVRVLAVLDRYWSEFHLPMRVTEFDINTDDEQLQADYTRDYLTLMFSHPGVIGFQMWGFWERAHWRPRGAMFRNDWSEKPNAVIYKKLVLDEWRTRAAGVADATGQFTARGFFGDYVAVVEANGRRIETKFTLRPGEPVPTIRVELK